MTINKSKLPVFKPENLKNPKTLPINELSYLKREVNALRKSQSKMHNLLGRFDLVKKPGIIIKKDKELKFLPGRHHDQFADLVRMVSTRENIFIVGPAGSGKTTAAIGAAKALNVEFYFSGAIASEYKLTGFMNANGTLVSTEFRKAYENGGLFLFDEIDASYPQALLAFNAALSNEYMDFPDGRIRKHKDFYCIAAANTYGLGADRQYVGRNQLDAASLDRFVFLEWHYDEDMELAICTHKEWARRVQEVRAIIQTLKLRYVVSPRASLQGANLLEVGMSLDKVEKSCLWKGMDAETIFKIKRHLRS